VRNGYLLSATLTFAFLGLYGCGDEVTDPDAFLESAEAEAILQSARALPMLPSLAERVTPATAREEAVLLRARELWAAGTDGAPRADAMRRRAAEYALPVLLEAMPPEEWADVRSAAEDWIGTAERMLQHLSLEPVQERVQTARRYLTLSDRAATDRSRAHYLLMALSELTATTPRFVARAMVRDAAAALSRVAPPSADTGPRSGGLHDRAGGPGERAMERAVRLKEWAEQAVAEGDYLLAIQRAYYAMQLVEGR
jgi:hypothetical protein